MGLSPLSQRESSPRLSIDGLQVDADLVQNTVEGSIFGACEDERFVGAALLNWPSGSPMDEDWLTAL